MAKIIEPRIQLSKDFAGFPKQPETGIIIYTVDLDKSKYARLVLPVGTDQWATV